MGNPNYIITYRALREPRSSYTLSLFVLDVLLLVITAGHWAIFMWSREMRRNTSRQGSYTIISWLIDVVMLYVSFGLWIIRIVFRELGRR